MQQEYHILSDEEARKIVLSVLRGSGGSAHKDDIMKVMDWAIQARLDEAMLDMVLAGEVLTRVGEDGDVAFKLPGQDWQN